MKSVLETGGIIFLGALTLLFASGKVFGFLDWSWWWIFSPIWVPVVALFFTVALLALLDLFIDK